MKGRRVREEEKVNEQLSVRVTKTEREFIEQECALNGCTQSWFVRTCIQNEKERRDGVAEQFKETDIDVQASIPNGLKSVLDVLVKIAATVDAIHRRLDTVEEQFERFMKVGVSTRMAIEVFFSRFCALLPNVRAAKTEDEANRRMRLECRKFKLDVIEFENDGFDAVCDPSHVGIDLEGNFLPKSNGEQNGQTSASADNKPVTDQETSST